MDSPSVTAACAACASRGTTVGEKKRKKPGDVEVTLRDKNFALLTALSFKLNRANTAQEKSAALADLIPVHEQFTLLQQLEAASPKVVLKDGLVTMECLTPSSIMRYTTHGEEPSEKSALYTEAFRIPDHPNQSVIKVRSYALHHSPSNVKTVLLSDLRTEFERKREREERNLEKKSDHDFLENNWAHYVMQDPYAQYEPREIDSRELEMNTQGEIDCDFAYGRTEKDLDRKWVLKVEISPDPAHLSSPINLDKPTIKLLRNLPSETETDTQYIVVVNPTVSNSPHCTFTHSSEGVRVVPGVKKGNPYIYWKKDNGKYVQTKEESLMKNGSKMALFYSIKDAKPFFEATFSRVPR